MSGVSSTWCRPAAIDWLLILLVAFPAALAQRVDEYPLKAAVLSNLANFVDWPAGAFTGPAAPWVICILGDSPIRPVLERAAQVTLIDQRRFLIRPVSEAHQAKGCHLLFFSSAGRSRWRSVLGNFETPGVLTVGESDGFADDGGMVNLKTEEVKIRIQVNLEAAQRGGFKFSSKLLSLAQIVKNKE